MSKALNLVGQKFNLLFVKERIENNNFGQTKWKCLCDCGKIKDCLGSYLVSGKSQSCGCLSDQKVSNFYKNKRKWVIGSVFGMLTAVEDLGRNNSNKKITFIRCLCNCGKEAIVTLANLTRGRSKSCGCQFTNYLGPKKAAERRLIRSYKNNALKRNILWDLNDADALELMAQNCHYCNKEPSNVCITYKDRYLYNGLDRRNNELFYRKNNVVPCCTRCNFLKGTMLYDEFLEWINDVAANHPRINNIGKGF